MSEIVLFAIGTVVFLYGLAVFRELQVRDETATRSWDAENLSVPAALT